MGFFISVKPDVCYMFSDLLQKRSLRTSYGPCRFPGWKGTVGSLSMLHCGTFPIILVDHTSKQVCSQAPTSLCDSSAFRGDDSRVFAMWTYLPLHSQVEWPMSNFPWTLTRNITQYSMKNLPFHTLLRRKIIRLPILTTSLIYVYLWKVGRTYF